ncbi:hypothetical protein ABEB36_006115 [Hypothenemus hampei]|uniref:DNA polymerase delta subunit 3 n=1 Tax=Hypothenemus hampei TaxID=57062 RepID=A0ABD1F376_HYPHA
MQDHLEKLEELVQDDNRIVTVPTYATLAHIPINESQNIISKFTSSHSDIHATFVLNGVKKDADQLLILLTDDKTIANKRQLFEQDYTEKLFSVQHDPTIDYNMIALSQEDTYLGINPLLGTIVGKNCIKRNIRKKCLPTLPETTLKGKAAIFLKDKISDEKKDKSAPTKKVENHGNISNLFNKLAEQDKLETKKKPVEPKANKDKTGFSNLFKSTNGKEVKKTKSSISPQSKAENNIVKTDSDTEILKDLNLENVDKPKHKSSKSHNKSATRKSTKKTKKNTHENKRKRIIVEESSDDSIFGSEKSDGEPEIFEDIIEKEKPEPVQETEKILPPKNKRRKAVRKMYQDDEGYIVTETEYVYETMSEDEEEPITKIAKIEQQSKPNIQNDSGTNGNSTNSKGPKAKTGGKKIGTATTNQPTLMNFFKKK